MQEGGLERRRASPPLVLRCWAVEIPAWPADVRPSPLSSHSTRSGHASFPWAAFCGAPLSTACSQTSSSIGRGCRMVVWAVRRWVRPGWSKKIPRCCGVAFFVVSPRRNQSWSRLLRQHGAQADVTEPASGLPGAALPRSSR